MQPCSIRYDAPGKSTYNCLAVPLWSCRLPYGRSADVTLLPYSFMNGSCNRGIASRSPAKEGRSALRPRRHSEFAELRRAEHTSETSQRHGLDHHNERTELDLNLQVNLYSIQPPRGEVWFRGP